MDKTPMHTPEVAGLIAALEWALDEVTTARQFHRGSALSAIDRKINDARAAIAKATQP